MKKIFLLLFLNINFSFAIAAGQVKVIPFIENQVIPIMASTFTVTEIQFGIDEEVESVQNGDVAAWTVDVSKSLLNTLFVKPTLVGSNTNMTVITNRHTYYFQLNSNDNQTVPLYAIKFKYPLSSYMNMDMNNSRQPSQYHWNYSFHGDKSVVPLHVFDDGQFTYFQLREGQAVPAIFVVDNVQGTESVVNFRREDQYLVVQRLAPQFTLRSGKMHVASIFNNDMIRRPR